MCTAQRHGLPAVGALLISRAALDSPGGLPKGCLCCLWRLARCGPTSSRGPAEQPLESVKSPADGGGGGVTTSSLGGEK